MNDIPQPEIVDASRAPLLEHLIEFRSRLIRVVLCFALTTGISYFFAADIYAFLVQPLAQAYPDPENHRLIYTGLTEAFLTYIQLACFSGFIFTFPMLAWQLYRFLAPGLYKRERQTLIPFLIGAPILFFLGAALAYYVVMPPAYKFFAHFQQAAVPGALAIQLEAKVDEYLGLVMHIIIAFGLAFQLPIVLAILTTAGFLTPETLAKGRRYALVAIVVFAGVVTPPDVFSQLALAIPMYGLYEMSIHGCRLLERRKLANVPDVFVP